MSVVLYKCPNCGASLEFDADSQHFECEFCLSSFTKVDLDQKFSKNENIDLEKEDLEEKTTEEFSRFTNI